MTVESNIPGADLPADIEPFWTLMQPIKNKDNTYPETRYTREEQQFWATAIIRLDQDLANLADHNPDDKQGLGVHRVKTEAETLASHQAINTLIGRTLMRDKHALYFGFTHGILPDFAALYNDPAIPTDAKSRMRSVIIGGTHGNDSMKPKRVLTTISEEEIDHASCIIAHDDVADSVGALAAFVQRIAAIRSQTDYNKAFVDQFANEKLSEEDRAVLFDELIGLMHQENIIAAIPIYKNALFANRILQAGRKTELSEGEFQWTALQLQFLALRTDIDASEWIMGDGVDTDIAIQSIMSFIPDEIRTHPAVQMLFEHTRDSKIRVGSTLKGLIALLRYRQDKGRPMLDLTRWVAGRITEYLQLYVRAYDEANLRQN